MLKGIRPIFFLAVLSALAFTPGNGSRTIKKLQGIWVHEKDALATVEIRNSVWTFKYAGHVLNGGGTYRIEIRKSLQYVDPKEKSEFMILSNEKDTLNYEILGLIDSTMSLIHYPSSTMHLYYKK